MVKVFGYDVMLKWKNNGVVINVVMEKYFKYFKCCVEGCDFISVK